MSLEEDTHAAFVFCFRPKVRTLGCLVSTCRTACVSWFSCSQRIVDMCLDSREELVRRDFWCVSFMTSGQNITPLCFEESGLRLCFIIFTRTLMRCVSLATCGQSVLNLNFQVGERLVKVSPFCHFFSPHFLLLESVFRSSHTLFSTSSTRITRTSILLIESIH